MICLQRGCALSASLQYPRGTQVCNMKNTDANKAFLTQAETQTKGLYLPQTTATRFYFFFLH